MERLAVSYTFHERFSITILPKADFSDLSITNAMWKQILVARQIFFTNQKATLIGNVQSYARHACMLALLQNGCFERTP